MKKIVILLLLPFWAVCQDVENIEYKHIATEPFRTANIIIVKADSNYTDILQDVGKLLVFNGFVVENINKEFNTLTTNYKNSNTIQWSCQITVIQNQIWLQGKYSITSTMGQKAWSIALTGRNYYSDVNGVALTYKSESRIQYDEMTKIANQFKEKFGGKIIYHAEK